MKEKIYALYRGDEFLYMGTKQEIANFLNVKTRTVDFYGSPTYKKRTNYRGLLVIKVEVDEE